MSSVRDLLQSECYECSQDKIGCLHPNRAMRTAGRSSGPRAGSSLRRRDVERRLNPAPEAVVAPLVAFSALTPSERRPGAPAPQG